LVGGFGAEQNTNALKVVLESLLELLGEQLKRDKLMPCFLFLACTSFLFKTCMHAWSHICKHAVRASWM